MALKETLVVLASGLTGLGIVVLAGAIEERQSAASVARQVQSGGATQTPAELSNDAIRRGTLQAQFAAQRHFMVLVQ